MPAWITLSEKSFFGFIFTNFWFISIIYLRSIFFEFFILLIFMFSGQVSHRTFSFTWWIVRTMSLLIIITFIVYLMLKRWRCFFRTNFSTSVKLFSFALFLSLTGSLNKSFSNDRSVWSSIFYYSCEKYKEYLVFHLINFLLVYKKQKHLNSLCEYVFMRIFPFLYFY